MDNLNVLVEAKKEYLGQLCLIMCPPMIEVFDEMYKESIKISKGRKILIMFQKLLKEVPNWSNAMSKQHTDNIADRCAWFNDLLAAVFVACTKILSAVRLKAGNKKFHLNYQRMKSSFNLVTITSPRICTRIRTFSIMNKVNIHAMKV